VTPETMDAIRAALEMQTDRLEAVRLTNRYLGMSPSHAQVAPVARTPEPAATGAGR